MTNYAIYIWCAKCKTTTVCKRISSVTGEKHFSQTVSIFYVLNSKNKSFQPIFLIGTCPMRKKTFVDNLRVEPTILCMEKISLSLKLFSGHFCRQSFIKTVRGPLSTDLRPQNYRNWPYANFTFCKSDVLVPILHTVWNLRTVNLRFNKALLIGHRITQNLINHNLSNGKSETTKRVLWQTVKT